MSIPPDFRGAAHPLTFDDIVETATEMGVEVAVVEGGQDRGHRSSPQFA